MKTVQAGKFKFLVDDSDYESALAVGWRVMLSNGHFYVVKYTRVAGKRKLRLLHRELMNAPDGMVVDHANGDGLDNRRVNLRLCTLKENNWNRAKEKGSSAPFKGITKQKKRWKAQIQANGKHIYLGMYETAEEAAGVYERESKKFFGIFALANREHE